MNNLLSKKTLFLLTFTLIILLKLTSVKADEITTNSSTFETAQAFLFAVGSGDMKKVKMLMAEDFVWRNEGDPSVPWIGTWQPKEKVINVFFPLFQAGLKVTSWSTDYRFVNGDQAVFMGSMSAIANKSGVDTGKFNWAVRVHVEKGKVKSWNWFEDSYAVSKAYHAKK